MDFAKYTLKTAAAAKLAGITTRALQALRARGSGPPCYRPGYRTVLYAAEDVREWAARRVLEGK